MTVTRDGDIAPLEELLRERVGGNLSKTVVALRQGPEHLTARLWRIDSSH